MAPKRKQPHTTIDTADEAPLPPTKVKKIREGPVSTLTPVGPRVRAVQGVKDESLLHMLCDDSKTGGQKELHFKKLVHAQINWNSQDDITKINSWRNQLYGRAGMKAKTVCMWHKDEENWLELYFHLLIVEGMKHGLMIPRAKDVLEDFNTFFKGKVLLDDEGEAVDKRPVRKHNAFVSKMNRVITELKERLETVLRGKSGDYFRPNITDTMLKKYNVLKDDLANKGVNFEIYSWDLKKDGPFAGLNDSSVVEHWHQFFLNLPENDEKDDVEMSDSDGSLVDSAEESEEIKMTKKDLEQIGVVPSTASLEVNAGDEHEKSVTQLDSDTDSAVALADKATDVEADSPGTEVASARSDTTVPEDETTLVASEVIVKVEQPASKIIEEAHAVEEKVVILPNNIPFGAVKDAATALLDISHHASVEDED